MSNLDTTFDLYKGQRPKKDIEKILSNINKWLTAKESNKCH